MHAFIFLCFQSFTSLNDTDTISDPGVDSIFVPYDGQPPIATRFTTAPAAEPYNLLPVDVPYTPYVFDDNERRYKRADVGKNDSDFRLNFSSPALFRSAPIGNESYYSTPNMYLPHSNAYF